jgi:hypothetical protein
MLLQALDFYSSNSLIANFKSAAAINGQHYCMTLPQKLSAHVFGLTLRSSRTPMAASSQNGRRRGLADPKDQRLSLLPFWIRTDDHDVIKMLKYLPS